METSRGSGQWDLGPDVAQVLPTERPGQVTLPRSLRFTVCNMGTTGLPSLSHGGSSTGFLGARLKDSG